MSNVLSSCNLSSSHKLLQKLKKKYLAWNVIQPFKDNYAQYENDVFKSSKKQQQM